MLIKRHKSPEAGWQEGGWKGLAVPGAWKVGKEGGARVLGGPRSPSIIVCDPAPSGTFACNLQTSAAEYP